jgi:hypothetical protein
MKGRGNLLLYVAYYVRITNEARQKFITYIKIFYAWNILSDGHKGKSIRFIIV